MLRDIPFEAVHGRDGPLVVVEPSVDAARGIVDVGHQDTLRPSALEPVMVGAVHLEHLSIAILSFSPLAVGLPCAVSLPLPFLHQPGAYRLPAHGDAFTLCELLREQGRTEVVIVLPVELDDPLLEGELSLRRLTPRSMTYPFIPLLLYPRDDPADLPLAQRDECGCLLLGESSFDHLVDHMESLQLLLPQHDTVPSRHPPSFSKEGV